MDFSLISLSKSTSLMWWFSVFRRNVELKHRRKRFSSTIVILSKIWSYNRNINHLSMVLCVQKHTHFQIQSLGTQPLPCHFLFGALVSSYAFLIKLCLLWAESENLRWKITGLEVTSTLASSWKVSVPRNRQVAVRGSSSDFGVVWTPT